MGVGLRLKTILRDKKMTIKELAEISGVSVNTLYSITKRDSERIDHVILLKLAEVLNVTPQTLSGYDVVESMDVEFIKKHPDFSPKTIKPRFEITKEDLQLLELGGLGAVMEFYRLPEELQKKAREDIKGFVVELIEKYKADSEE